MSITTKKGDKGMTSLLGGLRVRKDHIIVRTCAELDELCSFLGLTRSLMREKAIKGLLESIQKDLSVICSEIATQAKFLNRLKKRIDIIYIRKLEDKIRALEGRVKLKGCFSLLGNNPISSLLDVSRAITRRVEINTVTLKNKNLLKNHHILIYLNRLSDLLYLLSRAYEKGHLKVRL